MRRAGSTLWTRLETQAPSSVRPTHTGPCQLGRLLPLHHKPSLGGLLMQLVVLCLLSMCVAAALV